MNATVQQAIREGKWNICMKPRAVPGDEGNGCPYEYGPHNPERNVEGMPFLDWDSRSRPSFCHVCPIFMEELGFTPDDLEIRATLHCGEVMERNDAMRQKTPDANEILRSYKETMAQYPPDEYPEYYL